VEPLILRRYRVRISSGFKLKILGSEFRRNISFSDRISTFVEKFNSPKSLKKGDDDKRLVQGGIRSDVTDTTLGAKKNSFSSASEPVKLKYNIFGIRSAAKYIHNMRVRILGMFERGLSEIFSIILLGTHNVFIHYIILCITPDLQDYK
jgi:hypothetical protein